MKTRHRLSAGRVFEFYLQFETDLNCAAELIPRRGAEDAEKTYDQKYSPKQLVRCSLGNFSSSGKLIDLPLFALDCLAEL